MKEKLFDMVEWLAEHLAGWGEVRLRYRESVGADFATYWSERFLSMGEKMTTFVSVKNIAKSTHYEEFTSTFVYLLQKAVFSKIKHLTKKNVYFRILLTTFHVRRGVVLF